MLQITDGIVQEAEELTLLYVLTQRAILLPLMAMVQQEDQLILKHLMQIQVSI
jgi:hypothetical protein